MKAFTALVVCGLPGLDPWGGALAGAGLGSNVLLFGHKPREWWWDIRNVLLCSGGSVIRTGGQRGTLGQNIGSHRRMRSGVLLQS